MGQTYIDGVDQSSKSTFDALTDTPDSKTANQYVKANAGGTALEFGALAGGGDVVGPGTHPDLGVPQWTGADSNELKAGLTLATTVGDPGADTALVTEQGIREGLDAIGDKTVKATFWATIGITAGTTTGSITKPAGTNATIILNEWGTDTDALLSTIANGSPTFKSPVDSSGDPVTIAFTDAGAWDTSAVVPVPDGNHALVYVYTCKLSDFLSAEALWESELLADAVLTTDYDAQSILAATTKNTPTSLVVAEQELVGRLTGGNVDGITIGIADNNILQVDGTPVDNEYATFTAAGLDSTAVIPATAIEAAEVGTATYDDVQDFINAQGSRGKISGGATTNNGGDGSVATTTAGTGMVRNDDTDIAPLVFFDWPQNATISMTDDSTNYIYADYNSGTPQIVVSTDAATLYKQTYVLLSIVWRDGTEQHIIDVDPEPADGHKRTAMHLLEDQGVHRASGLVASNSGTQKLAVSEGVIWSALTRNTTAALDTNVAGGFKLKYTSDSGSSWTTVGTTDTWPDEQYNDITTGLENLTTNKYGVMWLFVTYDGDDFYMQYGQGDYSLADAEAVPVPSVMHPELANFGILIAKLVFSKRGRNIYCLSPLGTDL